VAINDGIIRCIKVAVQGRGWENEHPDQATRTRPRPAILNCSIRKAVPPRKNLAFPTEPFIAFADMSLDGSDQRHLQAAHGYIELGLFEEANAELEEIDPFSRHSFEVLVAHLAIYHGLEKWEVLAMVAKRLTEWNPKEPGFSFELAYATRRAESIYAAHAILTRAAGLHPNDGTIQFNLACYEAQLGNIDRARAHLTRATKADGKFSLMALDDPDLEPLWESLAR
jgi:tetratricopeptide (TPR) repeat protein